MGPMDKVEDSDIYLPAMGLEGLLRGHSGHGSGMWEETREQEQVRQL